MSYSINARGANKVAALAALAAAFDATVLASQPVHAHDKAAALATAETFVNLLPEDDSKDVSIHMNGYLSWEGSLDAGEHRFIGASVGVAAVLVTREGGAA